MSLARHAPLPPQRLAPTARVFPPLAGLGARLSRALAEASRRRADRRALERLPDRILKDIAMGRSEIPYASRFAEFEEQRSRLRRPRSGAAEPGACETRSPACP